MISVMEGDKQVAGIPVKIVKSTMSKIQSKQDDVGIVILEDLSEIEYSYAAEPPVQFRLSHLSRRSEPL